MTCRSSGHFGPARLTHYFTTRLYKLQFSYSPGRTHLASCLSVRPGARAYRTLLTQYVENYHRRMSSNLYHCFIIIARTATPSCWTRKRAFHFYWPGVVRHSHNAARCAARAGTRPSGPRGYAFTPPPLLLCVGKVYN